MDSKSKREGQNVKKVRDEIKKKLVKESFVEPHEVDQICSKKEDDREITKEYKLKKAEQEKKISKLMRKKKRIKDKGTEIDSCKVDKLACEDEVHSNEIKHTTKNSEKPKKKDRLKSKKERKKEEKKAEVEDNEVYLISSGDEDCSKGMKKWITEYHRSRPGLQMLQQRIDEFITAHDAKEEQATKDREERVAEGGWTVVKHHKGRKKTTDSESGIAVGSVAEAAVMDKVAKKKKKGVALDFYSFQRREAQRNEIMTLQSKFEQDKKRIQQMRAARKFRPY